MTIVLEGILVAESDGGERHPIEEVDFDADAHGEAQVECNATVGVVDEDTEGSHEDHEPDDSAQYDHSSKTKNNLTVQAQDQYLSINFKDADKT